MVGPNFVELKDLTMSIVYYEYPYFHLNESYNLILSSQLQTDAHKPL